mmetsp:Transcript_116745/g.371488  ORF Transcript_116745/g.371488 Transcript_116745/m.371488 type:complete len:499 (-) Transcript_116745:849-2345(-)
MQAPQHVANGLGPARLLVPLLQVCCCHPQLRQHEQPPQACHAGPPGADAHRGQRRGYGPLWLPPRRRCGEAVHVGCDRSQHLRAASCTEGDEAPSTVVAHKSSLQAILNLRVPLLLFAHPGQVRNQCLAVHLRRGGIQRDAREQVHAAAPRRGRGQGPARGGEDAERGLPTFPFVHAGPLARRCPVLALRLAVLMLPVTSGCLEAVGGLPNDRRRGSVAWRPAQHHEGIDACSAGEHRCLCHARHRHDGVLQRVSVDPLAAMLHHGVCTPGVDQSTVRQHQELVAGAQVRLAIDRLQGVMELQGHTPIWADVSRRSRGAGQIHLAHFARQCVPQLLRSVAILDEEPGVQRFQLSVDVLLHIAVAPHLAVGVQCQPILGCDQEVDDADAGRLPAAGQLHGALVCPHDQHAQASWRRGRTIGPRAAQLRGDDTQDRDPEALHVHGHLPQRVPRAPAAPGTAADADASADREAEAELAEDCGAPIQGAGLQHLVADAGTSA